MSHSIARRHFVEAVRSEFRDQLDAYSLCGSPPPSPRLVSRLAACGDILPAEHCEQLGLPGGSTYAAAAARLHEQPDHVVVDLHGFPTRQAVEEAESAVARAWEEARRWVTLIHGAADVRHWMHTRPLNRGSIKWALRGVLRRGEWGRYVYGRRSRRHRVGDGEMTLAVRPPLPA